MTDKVGRVPATQGRAAAADAVEPSCTVSSKAGIPNADDVRLLGAGPNPRGGFGFTFADGNENGPIHLMAAHLFEMMGCGTPHELNCVQMEVLPRNFAQAFTLTLQREGGKTPLRLKAEAVKLLKQTLEAIESGRSEPLFIMRDAIRNWLADDPASAIEARSDETHSGSAEGKSAVPDRADAQKP
jgi:hypothetical protein